MLHCGDIVDGNYPNRPEQPRGQQFLHNFDEQASYVVDMYPKVKDITTYYILGSHDETHYKKMVVLQLMNGYLDVVTI